MQHVDATRNTSVERRGLQRREVALVARIRVADHPWIACTVRNISPMGALLELAAPAILPRQFRLQIPSDLFEADCDLRHHHELKAGVFFTSNRVGALARYS